MREPVRTNQQYCCKCTHCADSPLGSRFAACGLWLTILNIVSYETYRLDNRTISVSRTKKPDRSVIERFSFLTAFPETVNYFPNRSQTTLAICSQRLLLRKKIEFRKRGKEEREKERLLKSQGKYLQNQIQIIFKCILNDVSN